MQIYENNIISVMVHYAIYLTSISLNQICNLIIQPYLNKITINNVDYQQSFNIQGNQNICLFDYSGASKNQNRIYMVEIYNNNTLLRQFIPCYRKSDNEPGMYDTVNDVFYTNAGTGTFIVGNDV